MPSPRREREPFGSCTVSRAAGAPLRAYFGTLNGMEPRPAASQEMSITYVEVQLMCGLGSSITPGSHSGAIGVLSWDLLGYTSVACMGQDSFSGLFCFIPGHNLWNENIHFLNIFSISYSFFLVDRDY